MPSDPLNPATSDDEPEPSMQLILCFILGAALIGVLLANVLSAEW